MLVDPLALVGPILLSGALAPDQDLPAAEAILAKVEAALGAADARAKADVIVMTGSLEVPGMSGLRHEQVYSGVDRVKYTTSFGEHGSQSQGATPDFAWSTDPASGITIKEGKERLAVLRTYAVERRAAWTSLYDSAKTLRQIEVLGKPHFELELMPKDGGAPDRWFVDAESSLPTAYGTTLPDPQGGDLAVRFVFEEWEDVGGAMFPYKKTMEVGGVSIVFRFDSIVRTIFVDDAKLAPPDEVLAAFADPGKRAKQAGAMGDFAIEEIAEQPVVSIRVTIDESDVSRQLGILYSEIMGYVTRAKLTPTAPPFARMHSTADGKIDLEAGMAVKGEVKGEGRVKASTLPGGRVATTWHVGPYHDLSKTCARLEAWMKEQGHVSAGGLWEVYWTDPGIEPDATKWRTQVLWPIR